MPSKAVDSSSKGSRGIWGLCQLRGQSIVSFRTVDLKVIQAWGPEISAEHGFWYSQWKANIYFCARYYFLCIFSVYTRFWYTQAKIKIKIEMIISSNLIFLENWKQATFWQQATLAQLIEHKSSMAARFESHHSTLTILF